MNIHLTWPDSADVDAGANSVNRASRWLLLIKTAKVITPDKEKNKKTNQDKTNLQENTRFGDGVPKDHEEVIIFESVVKTVLVKPP